MKIEIEKSEYDRLKSREEKYLAYMDMLSYRGEDKTEVDTLCGKVAELEEENKKLKEELEETKKDLEHRDSFFSIMRDVLANEDIDNSELASILYCVIHFECGDTDMSKKEVEIAEKFWFRDYV